MSDILVEVLWGIHSSCSYTTPAPARIMRRIPNDGPSKPLKPSPIDARFIGEPQSPTSRIPTLLAMSAVQSPLLEWQM
jgi:hypothetical protein